MSSFFKQNVLIGWHNIFDLPKIETMSAHNEPIPYFTIAAPQVESMWKCSSCFACAAGCWSALAHLLPPECSAPWGFWCPYWGWRSIMDTQNKHLKLQLHSISGMCKVNCGTLKREVFNQGSPYCYKAFSNKSLTNGNLSFWPIILKYKIPEVLSKRSNCTSPPSWLLSTAFATETKWNKYAALLLHKWSNSFFQQMKNPSLGQVFKLRSGDKHPIQSGALVWTLCTQRNGVQICSNQFCCCLACIRFHTHEAMPRHCQDLILRGHHWPKIETSALLTVHLHRYTVYIYLYIHTHMCVYVRVSVSVCVNVYGQRVKHAHATLKFMMFLFQEWPFLEAGMQGASSGISNSVPKRLQTNRKISAHALGIWGAFRTLLKNTCNCSCGSRMHTSPMGPWVAVIKAQTLLTSAINYVAVKTNQELETLVCQIGSVQQEIVYLTESMQRVAAFALRSRSNLWIATIIKPQSTKQIKKTISHLCHCNHTSRPAA